MADGLTEEQIAEFKEAFSLFDKEGYGTIPVKCLGTVLRSLQQISTEAEFNNITKQIDDYPNGTIDFPEFLSIMTRKIQDNETEEQLIEAFKILDRDGSDLISVAEFRYVITNLNEKLSDEEVEELIGQAKIEDDGRIHYMELVRIMMSY